jgi:AcrR family transcriptional regulator
MRRYRPAYKVATMTADGHRLEDPPRARKQRGAGHERRAEILAAAKRLFVSEGFETVTTRKLATAVGLSQTGLYVYFQSKEEILDALCRETFDRLQQRFRAVQAEVPLGPARLRRMVEAYVAFGLEHPDEYQLAFMVSHASMRHAHGKDLAGPFEEQPVGLQAFLVAREMIAEMMEAGVVRPVDPVVATQTCWVAMHGLVSLLIARPGFPWVERQVLIDALVDMIVGRLVLPTA